MTSMSTSSSLISSYRRSQYLVAGAIVPSTADLEEYSDASDSLVTPTQTRNDVNADVETASGDPVSRYQDRSNDIFEWDDSEPEAETVPRGRQDTVHHATHPIRDRIGRLASSGPHTSRVFAGERTPLLRKAISLSAAAHPRSAYGDAGSDHLGSNSLGAKAAPLSRQRSVSSIRDLKHNYGGQSTFGQTLFNSIAILLGIGMLSEPLAFAYAGWIGGTFLIGFYGFTTCYTAKLLARIILQDPRLRSYADIGRKAFGPKSIVLTSVIFCLELFSVSVVLVTLYADSLHTIAPQHSPTAYKLLGLIVLIPTVFLPLSLLSYASVLGILSTILIIAVIFIDGFTKKEAPGSLWNPADTAFGVSSWGELGVAFGLFMAGFSGHAVIPSLARDMVDPTQFDAMINWAFVIATFLYATIGYAGYLMFGKFVSDEVSMDLLNTPGYNPILNSAALWMLVISPLSKFALSTRPLNLTLEIMLGLDVDPVVPNESPDAATPSTCAQQHSRITKRVLTAVERVVFTLLSVTVSILVPEFSSMMAFLGSFSAFMICVIGPISAKVALASRCGMFDALLLTAAIVMATWGTVAAFWA